MTNIKKSIAQKIQVLNEKIDKKIIDKKSYSKEAKQHKVLLQVFLMLA